MSFTDFERDLITALLAGDHPDLAALREQFASATVAKRETSESGFATFIRVDAGPPVPQIEIIGDLQLDLGAATPAEAVLHVEEGRLHALECYVYEGPFPATPRVSAAWYYGSEKFPSIGEELFAARDIEGAFDAE